MEKTVIVTVTKEELNEMNSIRVEKLAVENTMETLIKKIVDIHTKSIENHQEWWDKINEKYKLDINKDYKVWSKTGDVTEIKGGE